MGYMLYVMDKKRDHGHEREETGERLRLMKRPDGRTIIITGAQYPVTGGVVTT